MGVIVYNNPDFQDALNKFGVSAANLVNAKSIKAKELLSNPQQMASIAPAYRRAKAAGAGDTFLAGLGVDPSKFAPYLDAYEPTNAERYDTALGAGGGPEAKAGAEIATDTVAQRTANASLAQGNPERVAAATGTQADVTTTTGQQALNSGLIQRVNDAQIAKATYEAADFNALLNADIPSLKATGQAQDFRTQLSKGKYEGSYYDILNNNGQAQIVANAERSKAMLGIKKDSVEAKALDGYVNGINSIDQSTKEGRDLFFAANAGIANPNFLDYIKSQQDLDLRARIANQASKPNAVETVKLGLDIQDKIQSRLEQLNTLRQKGGNKDEVQAVGQSINNLTNLAKDLSSAGVIAPTDVTVYDLKANVLKPELFKSNLAYKALSEFTNAWLPQDSRPSTATSTDEKISQVQEALSNVDVIAKSNGYGALDKRDLTMGLTEILEKLQEQAQLEKVSANKGTAIVAQKNIGKWMDQLSEENQYEASLKATLSNSPGTGQTRGAAVR